ncbi:cysteine--1-D-myo-inosityl 2-amino-2-deoxy-alpha-D-glucopyranoside ligase [Canibacter zhoujuaniae]|uniref:cysteine--1-D-myo-inosityl 2-amino-2-deoxy-alpha-D-glucopyranoside ligase n=1 Tax=Canibacter zhoujuaniae TaxID=2708343 RepID=UPI00141FAE02|nr:cysteine--1-D-myo-inosityl 2-amino-2-deoxy-alpha-D-glucopyranoside ligase [Canibacter zhoujuaniae]
MRTWTAPALSKLPGKGDLPRLFNTATGRFEHTTLPNGRATLYVCGITPYDATHLGHAFTYLSYDLLQRAWLDAGYAVEYAQNITDVDDPLLERAAQTHKNWEGLAAEQIGLFRSDMYQLKMLPPQHYVAVTEVVQPIAYAVLKLLKHGFAYEVDTPEAAANDIYFDYKAVTEQGVWQLGDITKLLPAEYLTLAAERGGDPDRAGKRDPLDPLLWRAAREGEPAWESPVGYGRPGWHVECAVIAAEALGTPFSVQGGGADLPFPHHEFSAATAAALYRNPLAHLYSHTALVSYQGHKMSKSRGNLVFVHKLLQAGYSGSEIRLALAAHHYRTEWEWQDGEIDRARARLARWAKGFATERADQTSAAAVLLQLRQALANDLDTPVMLAVLDAAAATGVDDPQTVVAAVQNLLGIEINLASGE